MIDCRDQSATTTQEGKNKKEGGSRQDYEIGRGGYLLVRLIGLEYRELEFTILVMQSGNVV